MEFSNLFGKLQTIFNMIIESNTLVILTMLIIATLLLRLSNKINNKKMGIIIYLIEAFVFGLIFFDEKEELTTLGNDLIDGVFLNFYFPSVYVYLFVFVFSTLIFIYTLLNIRMSKIYKVITDIYFISLNFIFVLLVNVIARNNIDVFEKSSLFTSNNALVLLELSTLLFLVYIIIVSLIYITNSIIIIVEARKFATTKSKSDNISSNLQLEVTVEDNNSYLAPDLSVTFDELMQTVENNKEIINEEVKTKIDLVPEYSKIILNNNDINLTSEIKPAYSFIDPMLFNDSVSDNIVKLSEEQSLKEKLNFIDFGVLETSKEDKFSLNDYKLFSNMLKTVIQNNNTSNLGKSEILNLNLLKQYSVEEYNKFEKILNSCLN